MDLKHQLVIWKRTGFLLDHVALSHALLDNLLTDDVITPVMAAEIQVCSISYLFGAYPV